MSQTLPIGPIMLDIEGLTLAADEKEKINHPNTGAVILFSRNYDTPEQLTHLIADLRAARNGPLLIAVDQEGGRVQRFRQGFTRLPPAAFYQKATAELAETAGWLMASELLAVGVDFSFAPVLDVDCGISEVIGDRSFSSDAATAATLAGAFRRGMKTAGMAATGKHFPGHGGVALDSHLALPIDDRTLDDIRQKDLEPFKRLINEGLEAVMPAHVVYSNVDSNPAGFSRFWIQQILRGELNFTGVVFSDDLTMAGAAAFGDYPERARMAQQAGCDMLLICNNAKAAEQVLESMPIGSDIEREMRLQTMLGRSPCGREQLLHSQSWQRQTFLLEQALSHYA